MDTIRWSASNSAPRAGKRTYPNYQVSRIWDIEFSDKGMKVLNRIIEGHEDLTGGLLENRVILSCSFSDLWIVEGRPRYCHGPRPRLFDEELPDMSSIQPWMRSQDDRNVEEILPSGSVTDRLLEEGTQFLGDNIFDRLDAIPSPRQLPPTLSFRGAGSLGSAADGEAEWLARQPPGE